MMEEESAKAVVVYESTGNTHLVADAIGQGSRRCMTSMWCPLTASTHGFSTVPT